MKMTEEERTYLLDRRDTLHSEIERALFPLFDEHRKYNSGYSFREEHGYGELKYHIEEQYIHGKYTISEKRRLLKVKTTDRLKYNYDKYKSEIIVSYTEPGIVGLILFKKKITILKNFNIGINMDFELEHNIYTSNETWLELCREKEIEEDVIRIINKWKDILDDWVTRELEPLRFEKRQILDDVTKIIDSNNSLSIQFQDTGLLDLIEVNQDKFHESNHIHQVVRLFRNIEQKRVDLIELLKEIKKYGESQSSKVSTLRSMSEDIKLGIVSYEMLVLSFSNMINNLMSNNRVQYYYEYELIESTGVFQSSWEKEVSQKLTNIGKGIKNLTKSVRLLEGSVVRALESNTNRIIEKVDALENDLNTSLSALNSSVSLNTFVSGIQAYQAYKLNKNLKK